MIEKTGKPRGRKTTSKCKTYEVVVGVAGVEVDEFDATRMVQSS